MNNFHDESLELRLKKIRASVASHKNITYQLSAISETRRLHEIEGDMLENGVDEIERHVDELYESFARLFDLS